MNGLKNGRACQLKGDVVRLVAIAAVISLMSPTIAIAKDCYRHHRHCHQESAPGFAYSVIAGEKRDKILPLFASLEDWWSGLSTPLQLPERPYHMTGKLEIMDKIYNFGTGGHGRGSIPFGDYPITPNEVGHWGERHDAIGINGNFIPDPKYPGQPRKGIEFHQGLYVSSGCIVIREWDDFMATLEDMFEEYDGQLYLHVGLNAAIITPEPTVPLPIGSPVIDDEDDDNLTPRHRHLVHHRHHYRHHHLAGRATHRHHGHRHYARD